MLHRILLFSVLSAFFFQTLQAQCVSGDCKNGRGTFIFPTGAKYSGDFKNGEIHGLGVCYYTTTSKYSGEWKNRYPEGKGTKTYADGTTRTGLSGSRASSLRLRLEKLPVWISTTSPVSLWRQMSTQ